MNRKDEIKLKHLNEKLQTQLKIVGRCRCGNALFISTFCQKAHLFNYYCTTCGSVGDIRFPKSGDEFNLTQEFDNPIKLLVGIMASDGRKVPDKTIEDTPISPYVNKGQGNL